MMRQLKILGNIISSLSPLRFYLLKSALSVTSAEASGEESSSQECGLRGRFIFIRLNFFLIYYDYGLLL